MQAQRYTLCNALRVAAEQYEKDAKATDSWLAEQFSRQAKEARTLADKIEQADVITLEGD